MPRRGSPALALALLAACGGEQKSPRSSADAGARPPTRRTPPIDAEAPTGPLGHTPPIDAEVPAPRTPALDRYLAAIPGEPPSLSRAITGTPGEDPDTNIPRCQKTGWSYFQCERVFPEQGLQWVRWECMHGDEPYSRSVICTRLAEYLHNGVGGPQDPALASALFDRQCHASEPAFHSNCYTAAETLMFEDPARALEFARLGCNSPTESPIGCPVLLRTLESGQKPRKVVALKVKGLPKVAAGSECKVWLWSLRPGSCGARLECGDVVLYGAGGSTVPCKDDGTGGEDMTTAKDGDPSFRLDARAVVLRDDKTGRLGAFTLSGRVE